jgi:hypothetical protein
MEPGASGDEDDIARNSLLEAAEEGALLEETGNEPQTVKLSSMVYWYDSCILTAVINLLLGRRCEIF